MSGSLPPVRRRNEHDLMDLRSLRGFLLNLSTCRLRMCGTQAVVQTVPGLVQDPSRLPRQASSSSTTDCPKRMYPTHNSAAIDASISAPSLSTLGGLEITQRVVREPAQRMDIRKLGVESDSVLGGGRCGVPVRRDLLPDGDAGIEVSELTVQSPTPAWPPPRCFSLRAVAKR